MTEFMRPPRLVRMLAHAGIAALGSTCIRRKVGCVLTRRDGHILAIGYNGQYSGAKHCNEGHPCPGYDAPSGLRLDACQAIHAEQNALLLVSDVREIFDCYCTASPCMTCVKLLLNTGCHNIVFNEEYPHPEAGELWRKAGRVWFHANLGPPHEGSSGKRAVVASGQTGGHRQGD